MSGDPKPPVPLLVGAGVAALQGLFLVALGGLEAADLTGGRLTMGVTTASFFLLFGLALLACAWAVLRLRTWARSPLILAQLIQLGIAWNLREERTGLSVVLTVVAVLVLVGLLHRSSMAALEHRSDRTGD